MGVKEYKVSLPKVVGGGYKEFWHFKGRYRVVKGSRGSKKSKTSALWFIVNMMKYKNSNLLVVRKTYRTLKDSCFAELKWAIKRLMVESFWKITESPLQLEYIPTGQKVYFRGLDDPLKVTSITVDVGYLCWLWIEEAYEITKEDDFNILDESIRGAINSKEYNKLPAQKIDDSLFKQITLTFNPWNERHWLKKRFFDKEDDEILALTTNYLCNEWLDSADRKVFDTMKKENPRRFMVAGLGEWGISEGLVYENFEEKFFDLESLVKNINVKAVFGLDFGYTNDPTAFFCGLVDTYSKVIYVFDEIYKKGLKNDEIYIEIEKLGFQKEKIIADSAEPKSIDTLRTLGLRRIVGARKGKDSLNNGIDFIQGFKIFVHPKCVNFLTEISSYVWDKDKFSNFINKPVDENNHLMDAMRYALEDFVKGEVFSFK
ncbi:MAG: PBSX family phage terminase large subunit [Lachnospirales bacterium]